MRTNRKSQPPDACLRYLDVEAEIIASLAFFGAIVVCPLVYILMKHQRAMAEIIHRAPDQKLLARIDALEREVATLQSNQRALVSQSSDSQATSISS